MRKTIDSPIFVAVYKSQNGECFYCQKKLLSIDGLSDDITIDHFRAISRGGTSHWKNCVLACKACNEIKGNRRPNNKERMRKRFQNFVVSQYFAKPKVLGKIELKKNRKGKFIPVRPAEFYL